MPLNCNVSCQLELKRVGWWLTFPDDPTSGLLLTGDAERMRFALDCGIHITPADFSAGWIFESIVTCPVFWHNKAKVFSHADFS